MEKEAEVKNALGTIFYRKENTNKSINKCTNPLLIVLFHRSNCPEDSVLQPVEEEMAWETVLLIKCSTEPAVSASVSGYAWILLPEIERKCLTSHATIILVKLVLLKHRSKGLLLLLDCVFLPFFNFTPVPKNAITYCELAVGTYFLKMHLRFVCMHAHPTIPSAGRKDDRYSLQCFHY